MPRIKIRLHSRQSEAKLLRFKEDEVFDLLVERVAKKLGVCSSTQKKGNGGIVDSSMKLYLGGDALVEDTSEIDDGDDLVLKVPINEHESDVVKEENKTNSAGRSSDAPADGKNVAKKDGTVTCSSVVAVKKDHDRVVDPNVYVGRRIAKYFNISYGDDGEKLELCFGRVVAYYPSDNGHVWEIEYDDGDEQNFALDELEQCIQLAKYKEHADNSTKPQSQSDGKKETDDDSTSSVEDVTDQVLQDRKKGNLEEDVVDIESDEDVDDMSSSDDDDYDDVDYEDDEDDLSYVESDDDCVKKRKAKATIGKDGKRARKPMEPPLEVLMSAKDVPAAPGKRETDDQGNNQDEMVEASTLLGSRADLVVKNRIIKLLNTGFHESSNEHEAKNAMKLAQRLMRKHNLSQAAVLKEREAKGIDSNEEVLKGGLVEVSIVNRKTGQPSQFARWIARLMHPVSKNFGVDSYYSVSRGRRCDVTFYGIYTNCQLAGYAFRVAVERISQMAAEYTPTTKSRHNVNTRSSRLSYALGIVSGISEEVDNTIQREKDRQKRKLDRARLAASKGEAYEESDDEGDDDDSGSQAYSIPDGVVATVNEDQESFRGSKNGVEHCPSAKSTRSDHETSDLNGNSTGVTSISGEALDRRLREMEAVEQNALALVDHREKVAERVLKENDIKVTTAAKRKPIMFDETSFEHGIEDSKEIDINQRAIRDEVKVKKEE